MDVMDGFVSTKKILGSKNGEVTKVGWWFGGSVQKKTSYKLQIYI